MNGFIKKKSRVLSRDMTLIFFKGIKYVYSPPPPPTKQKGFFILSVIFLINTNDWHLALLFMSSKDNWKFLFLNAKKINNAAGIVRKYHAVDNSIKTKSLYNNNVIHLFLSCFLKVNWSVQRNKRMDIHLSLCKLPIVTTNATCIETSEMGILHAWEKKFYKQV